MPCARWPDGLSAVVAWTLTNVLHVSACNPTLLSRREVRVVLARTRLPRERGRAVRTLALASSQNLDSVQDARIVYGIAERSTGRE